MLAPESLTWIAVGVFALAMVWAAVCDLTSFRIPNPIPVVVVAAFLVAASASDWSLSRQLGHLGAGGAMLVVCFGLFSRGYIGGGDAKLLAAAATWTGWAMLVPYLLAVTVLGGLLALTMIATRRVRLPSRLAAITWIARLHEERRFVPYGFAIGGGALIVLARLPQVAPLLPG